MNLLSVALDSKPLGFDYLFLLLHFVFVLLSCHLYGLKQIVDFSWSFLDAGLHFNHSGLVLSFNFLKFLVLQVWQNEFIFKHVSVVVELFNLSHSLCVVNFQLGVSGPQIIPLDLVNRHFLLKIFVSHSVHFRLLSQLLYQSQMVSICNVELLILLQKLWVLFLNFLSLHPFLVHLVPMQHHLSIQVLNLSG